MKMGFDYDLADLESFWKFDGNCHFQTTQIMEGYFFLSDLKMKLD